MLDKMEGKVYQLEKIFDNLELELGFGKQGGKYNL